MADVSPHSLPLRDVSRGETSFSGDELGETSDVRRLYYIVICWLHAGAVSILSVGWVQWLPDSTSHPQYEVGMPKWRVIRWMPTVFAGEMCQTSTPNEYKHRQGDKWTTKQMILQMKNIRVRRPHQTLHKRTRRKISSQHFNTQETS